MDRRRPSQLQPGADRVRPPRARCRGAHRALYARGQRLPTGRTLWGHLTVAALFGNALPYYLFAVAEQHIDSGVAGVINATTPLWTLALAYGTGHDRALSPLTSRGPAHRVRRDGGDLRPVGHQRGHRQLGRPGLPDRLGQLRHQLRLHGPLPRPPRHRPHSACPPANSSPPPPLLAVALPFADGFARPELRADAVAAIVILGALGTGAAYVLNYWLIAHEGTAASVVIYLLPVVAVILGAIVLAEPITWPVLLGMTIVLAGVALTRRRSPSPRATYCRIGLF